MSATQKKTWWLCYDICNPRRLSRVHRRLRKVGLPMQYSAFAVEGDDVAIRSLLAELDELIDSRVDDIRAYHIPPHCAVWVLGLQQPPEGVHIDAAAAVQLLARTRNDAVNLSLT